MILHILRLALFLPLIEDFLDSLPLVRHELFSLHLLDDPQGSYSISPGLGPPEFFVRDIGADGGLDPVFAAAVQL